jgi:hypothetical protein
MEITIDDVNHINNLVFDFVIYIIKRREFDIYNITRDQYDIDVCDLLFDWREYANVAWKHYSKQFNGDNIKPKPTEGAVTWMLIKICNYKNEFEEDETYTEIIDSMKDKYEILNTYAYYYIYAMGYEKFLLELKKYV